MLVSNALVSIFCGVVSAFMARNRGKNPYLWFALGTLFGVFGLLFLAFESKTGLRRGEKGKSMAEKDPNTIDITPSMDPSYKEKFWYYLDPQNQQFGPMSFDALIRAFKENQVTKSTFVWNEKLDSWRPLGDFINTPDCHQIPT